MNAKKTKNKNKSKPVQLVQENENTVSESVAKIEQVEVQSEKNEDSKVLELSIVEDNRLIDDVPKKPKRSKGKKKKDIIVEDNKPDELLKPLKHQELEDTVDNNPEECTHEVSNSRKKKNKNKKPKTQSSDNEDALSLLIEKSEEKETLKEVIIDASVNIGSQNIEIIENDGTTPKKKKKKKNRLDSDKSDKGETQNSCTLAFQKLLQSSVQETVDSETISKATLDFLNKTTEITTESGLLIDKYKKQPLKEIIQCKGSQTEAQNKKVKKQPQTEARTIETKESLESEATQDNIVITDDTNSKEKSIKPGAKIAKPVEKKRKVNNNLQGSNNESISSSLIKSDECMKLADNTQVEKVHIENNDIIQANIETKNVIVEQNEHKENTRREELPCDSSELLQRRHDEEKPEADRKPDYNEFVKVKTGKNKKKKNKDVENRTISETAISNLDTVSTIDNPNVLSEETKSCSIESGQIDTTITGPDFIDYPRSASQNVVDNNNNNTIIQEITTPEEIKLGIPVFSTMPVVQGSGESPETQINKADSHTTVTEIDFQTTNSPTEKIDVKSKMIEVNRDMEELRRSIERSLAELTNIENNDSNIEKDFEEIFQNQFQESKAVEIEDRIIRPGNESLSIKNEEANIDDKSGNDKTIVSENNSTLHNVPAGNDPQNTHEAEENLSKTTIDLQPTVPARKDKGKSKSKKKGKQGTSSTSSTSTSVAKTSSKNDNAGSGQEPKKEETSSQKTDTSQKDCEKQTEELNDNNKCDHQDRKRNLNLDLSFEPIENFEDALTSSVDDVNETFELIANETNEIINTFQYQNNPEINIIAPMEEIEQEEKQKEEERRKTKQTPLSQPKNLLGHNDIPAQLNKNDYKKEKNKAPNYIQAKVKIKDSVDIEKKSDELVKGSENKNGEVSDDIQKFGVPSKNTNQEFVYKYNFRKVFLQSLCHLCKIEIIHRCPCKFCSIVFYCSPKHKDEDWPQHQPLCFAVSTIAHLKDQKHIYGNAKNITGQEYRILRMQVILSCERILKRKLVPWEQEAMLYPRICADVKCREWKQKRLTDCGGCGQISYCTEHPEHLPPTHQRWCKPYALYKKLVMYHQNFGKMEPRLPTKVIEHYQMPDNINEVLGSMYEEKIDISDIQYAALTQIASAALTTVYCYQLFTTKCHSPLTNGITKRSSFTIHSIGSELHSEVDSLNKWETFFLHLTDVKELRVVFIDPDLNQSNLPLELLGKIKLCENCCTRKRRVIFNFEDKKNYHEYYSSDEFIVPNIVCAFNPNIQRSSTYSNKDNWPSSLSCILRQKIPFVLTSYTLEELKQDLGHIKRLSRNEFNVISEPKHNPFSSVRPDRNFITDHDMPLLFKNYGFSVLCGA